MFITLLLLLLSRSFLRQAVNRDPPDGRAVWQVRIQVRDGQRVSASLIAAADRASRHRPRSTLHPHPLPAPPRPHTPLKEEKKEEERGHPFPGVYFKWSGDRTSKIIPFQESPRNPVFSGGREVVSDAQEGEDTEKEEKRQEAGARKSPRMQEGGESGGRLPFPMESGDGAKRQRTSRPEAGTTRLQRKRKRGGEFMSKNRRTPKRKTREKTYLSTKEDVMQARLEAAGARPEIRRDKQETRRDSVRLSKIFPPRMKSEGVESGMGRRRMREAPFTPGGRSRLHHVPLRRKTRQIRQINIGKRKCSSRRNTHNSNHLEDEGNIENNLHISFKGLRLPHTNWTVNRRSVRCGGGEFLGHCHHPPCLVSSRLSARGAKLVRNRYRKSLLLRSPAAPGRPSGEGGGDVKRIDKRRLKREKTGNNAETGHIPPLTPNMIDEEKNRNSDKQDAKNNHNHGYMDHKTTITTTVTTHNHESTSENASTPTKNASTSTTRHSRPKRDTHTNANSIDKNLVYLRHYKAMNGRCDTYDAFSVHEENETEKKEDEDEVMEEKDEEAVRTELEWRRRIEGMAAEMRRDEVHVAETVVSVVVKDVNDNAPVFPNTTMYGEVQENGPISE